MSSFTAPLLVEYQHEIDKWAIDRSFAFWTIDEDGTRRTFTVPRKYLSDLATVPWWAQWAVPKSGRYNQAAVLHDYFYTHLYNQYNKAYADKIFLEAMTVLGVAKWRRYVMYNAVKIGGKGNYDG